MSLLFIAGITSTPELKMSILDTNSLSPLFIAELTLTPELQMSIVDINSLCLCCLLVHLQ